MALEASGATVVPVGVGQSRRLLELIPALGHHRDLRHALLPRPPRRARARGGARPARRSACATSSPRASRAPASARSAREIEAAWGASVADSFGMSDVWSTMAGECGRGEGLHLTTDGYAILELVDPASGDPLALEDGACGELVWTHLRREASPLLRYRSGDLATVWTTPCACGRTAPRIRIDGPRRRHAARAGGQHPPGAIGAVLDALPRRSAATRSSPTATRSSRRCASTSRRRTGSERGRRGAARRLRARFEVRRVAPGTLPVAEQKTRVVYRTARGDELPPASTRPTDEEPEAVTVTAEPTRLRPRRAAGSRRPISTPGRATRSRRSPTRIEAAGADEGVHCVVARGAGEHFSAGDDLFAAHRRHPRVVGGHRRAPSSG